MGVKIKMKSEIDLALHIVCLLAQLFPKDYLVKLSFSVAWFPQCLDLPNDWTWYNADIADKQGHGDVSSLAPMTIAVEVPPSCFTISAS